MLQVLVVRRSAETTTLALAPVFRAPKVLQAWLALRQELLLLRRLRLRLLLLHLLLLLRRLH